MRFHTRKLQETNAARIHPDTIVTFMPSKLGRMSWDANGGMTGRDVYLRTDLRCPRKFAAARNLLSRRTAHMLAAN